jgi:hypothetical protein
MKRRKALRRQEILIMSYKESTEEEERILAELEDLKVEDVGLQLRGNLLNQCQVLLKELEEFQQYLVKQKKDSGVELRHFKNSVRTEINSLEKVGTSYKNV